MNESINLRRQGLGGHDIAAIVGEHPFQTPLDVYLAKVEGIDTFDPNYVQGRGLALEPHLINHYTKDPDLFNPFYNFKIVKDKRYVHKSYNFMHAHPDGVIYDQTDVPIRGLECKAPTYANPKEWGDEGTNQVPAYIGIQSQWYCEVVDLNRWDILVDTPYGMRVYNWNRNTDFGEQLIYEGKKFWHDHILKKVPPAPQTLNDIKLLYPKSNGETTNANIAVYSDHLLLKSVQLGIKNLEKEKDQVKFRIEEFYKDAETCLFEDKPISTYATQSRNVVNEKKLKEEFPEAYEACVTKSEFRVLRLKIK